MSVVMVNQESHRRWEVQCLHSPATIGRKEGTALAFMDIDDCGNESYPASSIYFFRSPSVGTMMLLAQEEKRKEKRCITSSVKGKLPISIV